MTTSTPLLKASILTGLVIFTFLGTTSPPINKAQAQDCIGSTPCPVGDRSYHVLPPDKWDGVTPLPILIHFHGWGRQGTVPLNHKHIGQETRKRNVLLIAPNGLGKSWDFWRPGSRDTHFTKTILNDVEKRYPVDRSKLFVSGYSWGSSMAWRFSCEAGDQVAVLLGISGTFYDQSENCDTGPVEVRHVHGLKDTVMDFPFGPNGEETGPVRMWQRINGCRPEPGEVSKWQTSQTYTRYQWHECSSGKTVLLDVHKGGHWIARGWLARQLDELLSDNNDS